MKLIKKWCFTGQCRCCVYADGKRTFESDILGHVWRSIYWKWLTRGSTQWHGLLATINTAACLEVFTLKTKCKAKPDCSPPGCPPRHQFIIAIWSVNWSAQQLHLLLYAAIANVTFTIIVWIGPGFGPQNWLSWQRPLRDRKTNLRCTSALQL